MPFVHVTGSGDKLTIVREEDHRWYLWRELHLARLKASRSKDKDSPEGFYVFERFG